jgi:hypothetical protein
MPTTRHEHTLKPDRVRMLEALAAGRTGCTKETLRADGFTTADMVELVRAGLATTMTKDVATGSGKNDRARVLITHAGRRVLERAKRSRLK